MYDIYIGQSNYKFKNDCDKRKSACKSMFKHWQNSDEIRDIHHVYNNN